MTAEYHVTCNTNPPEKNSTNRFVIAIDADFGDVIVPWRDAIGSDASKLGIADVHLLQKRRLRIVAVERRARLRLLARGARYLMSDNHTFEKDYRTSGLVR